MSRTAKDHEPGWPHPPGSERDDGTRDRVKLVLQRLQGPAPRFRSGWVEDAREVLAAVKPLALGLCGQQALIQTQLFAPPGHAPLLVAEDVIQAKERHVCGVRVHFEGEPAASARHQPVWIQHERAASELVGEEWARESAHVREKRF